MRTIVFLCASLMALMLLSCDGFHGKNVESVDDRNIIPSLEDVAGLLAALPLEVEHITEVHDAVTSSSDNGYDEEYTMQDLFRLPGAGVGEEHLSGSTKSMARSYSHPVRELIRNHLCAGHSPQIETLTRSGVVEDYIAVLESSDIQIYWPFSDRWDGETLPVITFDPLDGSLVNKGYRIVRDADGYHTEEVLVDEKMALQTPVWVVNRNDDAEYLSIEVLRKKDPEWGSGGQIVSKSLSGQVKTLILRDFTMNRNYDSWFGGASEFFVKIGSVEDFTASTEAELKLYSPAVTDFMVVVRRSQMGVSLPMDVVLVSDWTSQLDQCAFMVTEDDGGTRTSWKCSAVVKVASRSYGFEVNLPFNTRDDIVWRGRLSRRYIEKNESVTGHFGNVDITFAIE